MNYIFYLKYQLKRYILCVLSFIITYGIMYFFEWRKPIILTSGLIAALVLGSLIFIFYGAYQTACQNPFNK